jgi:hypothetical protein
MTKTTERPDLLRHQGKVVPWVTRWSNEVIGDPVRFKFTPAGLVLAYEHGGEEREPSGILWQREGVMRGGEPEYSQVSTYRQRRAMRKCACQICGQKIDTRPIRWLMIEALLDFTRDHNAVTLSAPTCEACIPISLALCPRLKGDRAENRLIIANVLEYELWGVHGEGVSLTEDGKVRRHRSAMFSYQNGFPGVAPTAMMAKQQVVAFTKFTIEHLDDS